jgi:UDP-N-acetylglucosamine 4,6-dehydratase
MNTLRLIQRSNELFDSDIDNHKVQLNSIVSNSSFLVIGGAGTIGKAVTKEIFKRNPIKLHIVDLSENNLVELVRDIRSSYGYIKGDFQTFALDIGSTEYDSYIQSDGKFDYVLNLSAMKHVRSEKDPYTLMRMINVNVLNTEKTLDQSIANGVKKYFCVSSDKATNPVNMMGASKRIMEMFLLRKSEKISISSARFANVAFSDGSLLHGFNQRLENKQPIVAPNDIKRYFITPKESGELCLMSCLLGENRDIFFPKFSKNLNLISFSDIAVKYLEQKGYEAYLCDSEKSARENVENLIMDKKWPCLFSESNTSGEKDFEEFYSKNEILDLELFNKVGVIKNKLVYDHNKLEGFMSEINQMMAKKHWTKNEILNLFCELVPNFKHLEKGKYLDSKM